MATTTHRHRAIFRYGLAVVAVGFTVLMKWLLSSLFEHDSPFLMLIAAVMVSAWYGGFGPGLFATLLADLSSDYFFMDPPFTLSFTQEQGLKMGLFFMEGLSISLLSATLHAARRRAELSAAVAQELEHTLAEVSEAEQRRLGRDLHDGLGQHLTGLALMSKALQQKLKTAARPESVDAAEIEDLANEAIDWTRDLARGLTPMDLDRTNLPAALRELSARTERLCRIRCSFEGPDRLTPPDDSVALNLYRVAQEAVNNAVKHARAKQIRITLAARDGRTTLAVRDDGVGLTNGAANADRHAAAADGRQGPDGEPGHDERPPSGMGLRIMKYRANAVGASFKLNSAPGEGTTISCTLSARGAADTAGLPAVSIVNDVNDANDANDVPHGDVLGDVHTARHARNPDQVRVIKSA